MRDFYLGGDTEGIIEEDGEAPEGSKRQKRAALRQHALI